MTKSEIKDKLFKQLKLSRFEHILRVVETAEWVADVARVDSERLMFAALLHDCAKYMNIEEQINFAKNNKIFLSDDDLKAPSLLHARNGAFIARHDYGITDTLILNAIYVHPSGAAGMSRLARALFVCDYIEPGRNFKGLKKIRKKVKENFEEAVLDTIVSKNCWVMQKNVYLHHDGLDFYHEQIQRVKKLNLAEKNIIRV